MIIGADGEKIHFFLFANNENNKELHREIGKHHNSPAEHKSSHCKMSHGNESC